jgi:disulfide bond formation protein DsbB
MLFRLRFEATMSASSVAKLNALGLLAVSGLLIVAFGYQFVSGELPCPLCLLQRAAFVAVGVGLTLNLCVGNHSSHYAMTILSAVAGGVIAAKQILLHIVPGTGSFGSALFGAHFYSWAFLAFAIIIVGTALMLMVEPNTTAADASRSPPTILGRLSVLLFLVLALANGFSTVAECEGGLCPDNPTTYQMFSKETPPT